MRKIVDLDDPKLGVYNLGALSGVIAAGLAADSEIFQFRNSQANKLIVLKSIKISAAVETTAFAQGAIKLNVFKASAWSAQGTSGTGITIGTGLKSYNQMPDSVMVAGDIRIASTGALGAGTKTLESNAFAAMSQAVPVVAEHRGVILEANTILYKAKFNGGEYPLILGANEGFVIRATVPATGTWSAGVSVEWAEAKVIL